MTQNQGKTILITGANTGLGKEMARQLALREDFERIYLGCRNAEKAERAKKDLETVTGHKIFEVVIIDLEDLVSVGAAVAAIAAPLNALAMIAGGIGGPTPASLTEDRVTELFAQNLLGHVVLLENLLAAGLLTDVAVLAGSEGARGIPKLRIARPSFTDHSSQEFASVIDGSFFQGGKFAVMLSYSQIKYLGALWMGAMARMHPELRFITMSPGNTAGTEVLRDQPAPVRIIAGRIRSHRSRRPFASGTSWTLGPSDSSKPSRTSHCRAASSTQARPRRSPDRSSTRPRSFPTSATLRSRTTHTRRSGDSYRGSPRLDAVRAGPAPNQGSRHQRQYARRGARAGSQRRSPRARARTATRGSRNRCGRSRRIRDYGAVVEKHVDGIFAANSAQMLPCSTKYGRLVRLIVSATSWSAAWTRSRTSRQMACCQSGRASM